jgi:hypothetical protein
MPFAVVEDQLRDPAPAPNRLGEIHRLLVRDRLVLLAVEEEKRRLDLVRMGQREAILP